MAELKKCLFCVTNLDSGGIENYLLRFLKHYDGKISATILCKGNAFGELESEFLSITGIKLIKVNVGYLNLIAYYKIYNLLRNGNFKCIVDFSGNFAAIPLLTGKLAGVRKRIAFYRGSSNRFTEDILRLTYNRFMHKIVNRVATDILSNSQAALKFFFKNKSDSRFEVVYNGISSEAFLSTQENLRAHLDIPQAAFVIGHVGRYHSSKNHKVIIEVAIELCRRFHDIYFVFCGKDVDQTFAKRIIDENLADKIKLLGYRKDVIKVLNSLNLFYFPSLTEGQPNALIESLIAGLPFVASNIAPIKETIPLKYHHLLVDPDDKESAILKILEFYESGGCLKDTNLKSWAISNYDSNVQFQKFYDKL